MINETDKVDKEVENVVLGTLHQMTNKENYAIMRMLPLPLDSISDELGFNADYINHRVDTLRRHGLVEIGETGVVFPSRLGMLHLAFLMEMMKKSRESVLELLGLG